MAAIQNIKILHKRYSSTQWASGVSVNGQTITPMLAQGEIGLATDTLEVRIGTNSAREQTWGEARPIGADVTLILKAKNASNAWETVESTPANTVVVNVEVENVNGKHRLIVYFDKISKSAIADYDDFKVTEANSITAGEGEVKVVTKVEEGAEHEAKVTYGAAATKTYVDSKFSTAKYIDVIDDTTLEESDVSDIKEGEALEITYVANVKESTADHTIELDKKKLIIPSVTIDDTSTGDYISDITIDQNDSHKIKVTRANLPEETQLSVGTGSGTGNGATVVGGISVDGHTITGHKKTIKSGDSVIKVTGDTESITITADTYTKAEIDEAHNELAKAMKFKGTLDVTGSNGLTALPSNAKQGDVYKVTHAGTYGAYSAKIGDIFIYDGSNWRYVPSGDESFTDTWRQVKVEGKEVKSNDIGTGAIDFVAATPNAQTVEEGIVVASNGDEIQIAHADTSNVEDASRVELEVIDGMEFDGYGHVQSYLKKKIKAGSNVSLSETNGEITIDSSYENTAHTHSAGAKLKVTGNGGVDGNVEYSHEAISTTTSADTSKNKTIVAGGIENTFTVVDSLINDGYGHITDVKTKEITVNVPQNQDTKYDLTADNLVADVDATIHLKGTDSTDDTVKFKGADGTTISVKDGIITVTSHDTTYELATSDLAGLVKVANVLSEAASVNATTLKGYTGNNNDKLYGVNRRADGTTFVEVPWHDTTYSAGNGIAQDGTTFNHGATTDSVNKNVDMYAFGTDAYGHAQGLVAITTIDGNYA